MPSDGRQSEYLHRRKGGSRLTDWSISSCHRPRRVCMVTRMCRGRPISRAIARIRVVPQERVRGSSDMASAKYEREYGQHLVEQVLKGKMTRRQLLVRASVFGFSMTAAGSLLAACGGSSTDTSSSPSATGMPAPVMGGTLKMIGPAPITDPDPVTIYDQGGIVLVSQFLEYLINLNDDNSLKPVLAESWTPNDTLDVWTFKLRAGVTFNDGSPFEAEDVVTTVERLLDPEGGSGGAKSQWGGVLSPKGTKAVDATTVEFNLDKPYADFPYTVSNGNYNSAILPRELQRRHPQEAGRDGRLHARPVHDQAEGDLQEEPDLLGQGRRGPAAPVPGRPRVRHGRGQLGAEPAAAVRRRGLPAADGVPGRAGAVQRSQPPRRHLPGHGHPRGRVQPDQGAVEERRRQSLPGCRLLPGPPRDQQGSVRRPQQPRLRHLLAGDGVPEQPSGRPSAPRTTTRPSSSSPTPVTPVGWRSN